MKKVDNKNKLAYYPTKDRQSKGLSVSYPTKKPKK